MVGTLTWKTKDPRSKYWFWKNTFQSSTSIRFILHGSDCQPEGKFETNKTDNISNENHTLGLDTAMDSMPARNVRNPGSIQPRFSP